MAKPLRLPNATEQVVLDGLIVRPIVPSEQPRWDQLVTQRHYLKNARLVGEQRRYVAEYAGQWLVLLGWSAPAWHLQARDQWLGWSDEQRQARLHFLAQNSRCLVLADRLQFPNLLSRALGLCCARLSADWLADHGHPNAANWAADAIRTPANTLCPAPRPSFAPWPPSTTCPWSGWWSIGRTMSSVRRIPPS